MPHGHVPLSRAEARILGPAEHDGSYADLYGGEWIGLPRQELAAACLELGISELDASALQRSIPRTLTQCSTAESHCGLVSTFESLPLGVCFRLTTLNSTFLRRLELTKRCRALEV